jgi:hypothetical protein
MKCKSMTFTIDGELAKAIGEKATESGYPPDVLAQRLLERGLRDGKREYANHVYKALEKSVALDEDQSWFISYEHITGDRTESFENEVITGEHPVEWLKRVREEDAPDRFTLIFWYPIPHEIFVQGHGLL